MTLFALYQSPDTAGLPMAVGERFSVFAFLLPPLHALLQRHWDQLALFGLGVTALVVAAPFIGAGASFWLYVLMALAFGFAAPGAARRALRRRGFLPAGHVFAADQDLARLAVLEPRP